LISGSTTISARAPSRFATCSTVCAIADSSDSSKGADNAVTARRDSSNARSAAELALLGLHNALDELTTLGDEERQLLRETIVQLARHSPPLLEDPASRNLPLIATDLTRSADQDQQVGAQTK
jgi:hypothetical protein